MGKPALLMWKDQVFSHQQQAKNSKRAQQQTLFDLARAATNPDEIDPFSLRLHSLSFWRLPSDGGDACIYFVIDNAVPLLLYVGETRRSDKRWKGQHDCKAYLENYIGLHRQYGLDVAACISFWWDVPQARTPRQQLERSLIEKWMPPFNRECWKRWGQPFGR